MTFHSGGYRFVSGRAFLPVLLLFLLLLPVASSAQLPLFAVVSDSHVGSASTAYPAFIKAIDEAGIDVIIHLGDAINTPGSTREWNRFLEMTGPGKKLYLAPGNHDIKGESSLSRYLSHFPKPYYSFSEGDSLFVLLNTEMPGEEGTISGEQLGWLKAELEKPFRYKLVFLHEPPFSVIPLHGLDRHRAERDQLHRLFVASGVCLVVAGHDHIYSRTTKDGVTYVTAGASGGTLPRFMSNGDVYYYMIGSRKGKVYFFAVKDMSGGIRDEFSVGAGQPAHSAKATGQ